jgi:hypothetical protein
MSDTRIADKVRKLLALAGANPSPEEAALAFATAQEIATRAGLDLDELQAEDTAGVAPPPREVEAITHRAIDTWKKAIGWKLTLARAATKANGCDYYRNGSDGVAFFGQPSDIDAAAALYHALVAQVEAMAVRAVAAYKADPALDPRFDASPRVYGASWRIGCCDTIAQRLPAKAATVAKVRGELLAAPAVATTGGALVRVDAAAEYLRKVEARTDEYGKRTLKLHMSPAVGRVSSAAGYESGRKAGAGVGIGATRALGKGRD